MYFLIHARFQLGREEYQIIEAKHILAASEKFHELFKNGVLPMHVEIIGPLGMDHFK
jgi:hypothetical protein